MVRPNPDVVGYQGPPLSPSTIFNVDEEGPVTGYIKHEDLSDVRIGGSSRETSVLNIPQNLTQIYGPAPSWAGKNGSYAWALGFLRPKRLKRSIIEEFTVDFNEHKYAGHWKEPGYNVMHGVGLEDCVIRRLILKNCDNGLIMSQFVRCTIEQIDIYPSEPNPNDPEAKWDKRGAKQGHHFIEFDNSHDCLAQNIRVHGVGFHDIGFSKDCYNIVVQYCRGIDSVFDFHGGTGDKRPRNILIRRCIVGKGTNWQYSSGNKSRQPHAGPVIYLEDNYDELGNEMWFASTTEFQPDYGEQPWTVEHMFSAEGKAAAFAAQGLSVPGSTTPEPPMSITVLVQLDGNPATEPYAVVAIPSGGPVDEIRFFIDGIPDRTERYAPYSLFEQPSPTQLGRETLDPGSHTVQARAYVSGQEVARGELTFVEGNGVPNGDKGELRIRVTKRMPGTTEFLTVTDEIHELYL